MKLFTETHEWIEVKEEIGTVGVTDHAQKELGEIVYIELPHLGKSVKVGEEVAVLESTKAASDIYSPLSGQIVEVNTALTQSPQTINQSAESRGWIFKIKLSDPKELNQLLDENAYHNIL